MIDADVMEFVSLLTGDEVIDTPELRERAGHRSATAYTHHYIVRQRSDEIAFLSLDFHPDDRQLYVYEIFVRSDRRARGLGTRILDAVEKLAAKREYREIVLHASPLDESGSKEELCAWYEKRGYRHDRQCNTLVKSLERSFHRNHL